MSNFSENFVKDFFSRSLFNYNLYNKYHDEYPSEFKFEVTQLINSLLGLLVFLKQETHETRALLTTLCTSRELQQFFDTLVFEKNTYTTNISNGKKRSIFIITKLRNAVAHGWVCAITEEESSEIKVLKFADKNKYRGILYEFSIELSLIQIREMIQIFQNILMPNSV